MKKVLLGLAVVVCIALGTVWIYVDEIVGGAIQRGGSAALGVDVSVDFVRLSPFDGKLRLNGLDIANPPGFDSNRFLRVGSGRIAADLGTVEEEVVEVQPLSALRGEEIDDARRPGQQSDVEPVGGLARLFAIAEVTAGSWLSAVKDSIKKRKRDPSAPTMATFKMVKVQVLSNPGRLVSAT